MEQVLESRRPETKIDWRTIEMYDDEGKRITNPKTLRAMAEGQELVAEWERRIDSYHLEDIFGKYDEEEADLDSAEEKVS